MPFWEPEVEVEQALVSAIRMSLVGIPQPLEGLGDEMLGHERPLTTQVKQILSNCSS